MRLHQSYSAYLLGRGGKTMRELRATMGKGRKPTEAMEKGTLLDQLLYGGNKFVECQPCTKRSGPEKGVEFEAEDWTSADAQEQRAAARADGKVCVLKHEADTAIAQRDSVRETLLEAGIDLLGPGVVQLRGEPLLVTSLQAGHVAPGIYTQPKIQWTSEGGVECEGTLDILQVSGKQWRIIDTKLCERADEDWFSKQAASLGWDVQSAAYIEACARGLGLDPELFAGYGLCVCEKRSGLHMSAVYWLEDMFLHCGGEQWGTCLVNWADAIKNDSWPGILGGHLSPPGYHVSRIFDAGSGAADDLSSVGLDVSGLETQE